MKQALVCGAGGFIGSHLVKRLKEEEYFVIGVDLKFPEFEATHADAFFTYDLRDAKLVDNIFKSYVFDEVYQLAADMGGAGYIFTGEHDADVMSNSAMINLNVALSSVKYKVGKVFYSSSACMYPAYNQTDPDNPKCSEDSAYPAAPDSEYGWEKLFSERLYLAFARNYNLNVRIARFHNVYGPYGTFKGGKEKAPAAMCRKAIESWKEIEVWGDGSQTRSFLFIDDCIDGVRALMQSDYALPVNIGSEEMVSINQLAQMVITISRRKLGIKNITGPIGVRGRNSDNRLINEMVGWLPKYSLRYGLLKTYEWIRSQMKSTKDNLGNKNRVGKKHSEEVRKVMSEKKKGLRRGKYVK